MTNDKQNTTIAPGEKAASTSTVERTPITLAITDDHPLVISGLHHILGNSPEMEVIGSYSNGTELLKGIAQRQPDVLLLDIQMPGLTGDDLAEMISEQYPCIKMIALTNLDNVFYIKNML